MLKVIGYETRAKKGSTDMVTLQVRNRRAYVFSESVFEAHAIKACVEKYLSTRVFDTPNTPVIESYREAKKKGMVKLQIGDSFVAAGTYVEAEAMLTCLQGRVFSNGVFIEWVE